MLQVVQYQKTGELSVQELLSPQLYDGAILVRNKISVVSSGTERTSVETAKASLVKKARTRPDLVKQVVDNLRREGPAATYKKVRARLDNYKELGYSSAGIVVASSVPQFKPGDRVACGGDAHHAEIIVVPRHLAARIPDNVSFDEAAFTAIAAIAIQGIRQANVRIGENVAVIGLGLIGLITVQLLHANGCRVIGMDISPDNFAIARKLGCALCLKSTRESKHSVEAFTRGYGTDAVIIAAGTLSSEPLTLACEVARKKSTIVVVGSIGMNVPRSALYEKELVLTIACSYGPGRYDRAYEYEGADYPLGHVRWTENRNMESILDLMASRALDVKSLITHRFEIRKALEAYHAISKKKGRSSIAVLLEYPDARDREQVSARHGRIVLQHSHRMIGLDSKPKIGFIGAGNFAQSNLLPILKKLNVHLSGVAVSTPANARAIADKFGFSFCATDPNEILKDTVIDTVFVATRHDSHAQFVIGALENNKHVFVEKPLAVTRDQLRAIGRAYNRHSQGKLVLMTGFNRRFSRPFQDIRDFFLSVNEPLIMSYRVNAGILPSNHWLYEPGQGGRLIGEACHFIDCMSFVTNSFPTRVFAESFGASTCVAGAKDSVNVVIRFANGSVGNLLYFTEGDPSVGKEFCEVAGGGASAIMDNFKTLTLSRSGRREKTRYSRDKGHSEEVKRFVAVLNGQLEPALSVDSMIATSSATLAIGESLLRGEPVEL